MLIVIIDPAKADTKNFIPKPTYACVVTHCKHSSNLCIMQAGLSQGINTDIWRDKRHKCVDNLMKIFEGNPIRKGYFNSLSTIDWRLVVTPLFSDSTNISCYLARIALSSSLSSKASLGVATSTELEVSVSSARMCRGGSLMSSFSMPPTLSWLRDLPTYTMSIVCAKAFVQGTLCLDDTVDVTIDSKAKGKSQSSLR